MEYGTIRLGAARRPAMPYPAASMRVRNVPSPCAPFAIATTSWRTSMCCTLSNLTVVRGSISTAGGSVSRAAAKRLMSATVLSRYIGRIAEYRRIAARLHCPRARLNFRDLSASVK